MQECSISHITVASRSHASWRHRRRPRVRSSGRPPSASASASEPELSSFLLSSAFFPPPSPSLRRLVFFYPLSPLHREAIERFLQAAVEEVRGCECCAFAEVFISFCLLNTVNTDNAVSRKHRLSVVGTSGFLQHAELLVLGHCKWSWTVQHVCAAACDCLSCTCRHGSD